MEGTTIPMKVLMPECQVIAPTKVLMPNTKNAMLSAYTDGIMAYVIGEFRIDCFNKNSVKDLSPEERNIKDRMANYKPCKEGSSQEIDSALGTLYTKLKELTAYSQNERKARNELSELSLNLVNPKLAEVGFKQYFNTIYNDKSKETKQEINGLMSKVVDLFKIYQPMADRKNN
jgi:hypothetical protein